jgi:hypothetical protein
MFISDANHTETPTLILLDRIHLHLQIRTPSVIRAQVQALTPLARENEVGRGGCPALVNEADRKHLPVPVALSPRTTIGAEAEEGDDILVVLTTSPCQI